LECWVDTSPGNTCCYAFRKFQYTVWELSLLWTVFCHETEKAFVYCLFEISGLTSVLFLESPDLSLLIQNKGKGSLSVTISAPDFVHLEKTKIQLKEKEDKKVFMTDVK